MTALILLRDWQESQIEFWRKTIFEGYDVSSFGRVRSYWHKVANKGRSKGFRSELSTNPQIIQGAKSDSSGYAYLNVSQSRHWPKIHQLVADAFLPPREAANEVNHKTGLKSDNRLGNLERVTRLENIQHAWRIGLRDNIVPKGEDHYGSKISDERIREMQRLYDSGVRPTKLASMFGVTLANTYDLAKGVRGRGKTLREKRYA